MCRATCKGESRAEQELANPLLRCCNVRQQSAKPRMILVHLSVDVGRRAWLWQPQQHQQLTAGAEAGREWKSVAVARGLVALGGAGA